MSDDPVTGLIEQLSSAAPDPAWADFLERYSPLIRHVIGRHEHERERATECFTYVCGALSDDRFRRLRAFRPEGPARFQTWLMAVVSNLCHDWRRRQRGRMRPVRSVSRLPELDQHVYRCIFVGGMSRAECAASLAPRFPSLTETSVAEISARLFGILTPQQRWHLGARAQVPGRLQRGGTADDEEPAWQVATQEPGPGDLVEELEEQQRLREALSQLPADQRFLLRLRYEQELTLAEVARLTRQPDPFRANRRIQAALDALGKLMGARRPGPGRKDR